MNYKCEIDEKKKRKIVCYCRVKFDKYFLLLKEYL